MKFASIFINRIRVLFSDKLFILAILIVPMLLSIITGYAQRKEKLGYIPVVLVDEDGTGDSQLLCKRLAQKEGLNVVTTVRKKALAQLKEEKAEAMIVIEEGFGQGLHQGNLEEMITLVKSPSTYSAELLKEIVAIEALRIYTGYFTYDWVNESFQSKGLPPISLTREDISRQLEEYWYPQPIMAVSYEEIEALPAKINTITIPSYTAASLGLMVLFIMMGLLFGSGWICEEKANGTLQRILSVKGASLPLFLGNGAALFTMGLLQTLVFYVVQKVLFHVTILQGVYTWLVICLYIICVVSISMLMAALFETPHQLQAAAPVFALITGLMGGCLWNLLGVPKSLLTLALLTPQGWTLQALTGLFAAPQQGSLALPSVYILSGISLIFFSAAYAILLKGGRSAIS